MGHQLFNMTIRDAGGQTRKPESSTVGFRGTLLLADGTNYVAEQAKQDALRDATNAVHIGLLSAITRGGNYTKLTASNTHASNNLARREVKWLLQGHDTVTFDAVTNEIPCADISLCASESDYMDETLAEFTNLKTAYDAFHQSNGGNPCALNNVLLVGRNL